MSKCEWQTPDGASCEAEAQAGKALCWFHNPDVADARREASRRGGKASRRTDAPVDLEIALDSAEGILRTTQSVAEAVARGELDRSRANSIAYLVTASVQALKVASYEKRLKKVEERLGLREVEDAA